MPYATQADLTPSVIPGKTLIELTDDVRSGEVNMDIVTGALNQASGIVEMYCRQRYALPLQQTLELAGITSQLAAFLLYSRRPGNMPEPIKDGNDNAMRLLRDVSTNKASLDQPIQGAKEQSASGGVVKSRRTQVFSNCNLEGFK